MLETRGDLNSFVAAVGQMGCECATTSDHRLKIILQQGTEIRSISTAAASRVQIRRLAYNVTHWKTSF